MVAPGVVSEMLTVCVPRYVPPGRLNVGVAAGAEVWILMALILGQLAVPVVNWMAIVPLVTATGNDSSTAVSGAPAAATMSKFVSTGVPLIDTLKTRCPAVVK